MVSIITSTTLNPVEEASMPTEDPILSGTILKI